MEIWSQEDSVEVEVVEPEQGGTQHMFEDTYRYMKYNLDLVGGWAPRRPLQLETEVVLKSNILTLKTIK